MRNRNLVVGIFAALFALATNVGAQDPAEGGTQEFGLTERQLVKNVEKVEELIARCMRQEGFQYIPADYATVRQGMEIVETMPGMEEEEFVELHGYGISTLYTGQAPQLSNGYNPARVGLGQQNVEVFKNLSTADQIAYTRALFGSNVDATFAVGLEEEDFSRCGGCTQKAIAQVFDADQLDANYYNPMDALVNQDPRMKAALREFSEKMREEGYDYDHPDDVKPDLMDRLDAITDGRTIPLDKLSPERLAALEELQEYERKVAVTSFESAEEIFDPVEERIQKEMFSRDVK